MQYKDKHGNEIRAGMSLRHDDGEIKLVYASDNDLGFNASNEQWAGFSESSREIYPLYQFNMAEWEIVQPTKRTELYTSEDCLPESYALDWNDRVLVLNPKRLAEPYRKPEFQLWRGDGGFGCKPHTVGTAVFAVCLADDERARWGRGDFLGVLKPELIPESML